jgi:hypothetical protein
MKKLNKRARRLLDMAYRYHLTTCEICNEAIKSEIPAWEGYKLEAAKMANHAAMLEQVVNNYHQSAELVQLGNLLKGIKFCKEIAKEWS